MQTIKNYFPFSLGFVQIKVNANYETTKSWDRRDGLSIWTLIVMLIDTNDTTKWKRKTAKKIVFRWRHSARLNVHICAASKSVTDFSHIVGLHRKLFYLMVRCPRDNLNNLKFEMSETTIFFIEDLISTFHTMVHLVFATQILVLVAFENRNAPCLSSLNLTKKFFRSICGTSCFDAITPQQPDMCCLIARANFYKSLDVLMAKFDLQFQFNIRSFF